MTEQPSAYALPEEQLHVLRHTLGIGEDGCDTSYRNHFVTGAGGADHAACTALVSAGLMTRHNGNALSGGDDIFTATPAGRIAACGTAPKLTRSKKRYRAWLESASTLEFGDWLRSSDSARLTTMANVTPPCNLRTQLRPVLSSEDHTNE